MSKNGSPRPENHVIVLFGATGDLARRKLLPGLFHLHAAGLLPREYRVIGASPPANALTEAQQATIAELKSTVAQQQKGMEVLTAQLKEQAAQIEKVTTQIELNKFARRTAGRIHRSGPAPQIVINP